MCLSARLQEKQTGKAIEIADQCLDACHLSEIVWLALTHRFQKRLEMARTLATGPKLMMLDRPWPA